MKKKNGFTLVELLAVIVVLAIIMIIAIPGVLNVMNKARKSSFVLYAEKVIKDTETQYVYDSSQAGNIKGAGWYVYDITQNLNYQTTGDYRGFVVVNALDVDNVEYILFLYDKFYMISNYNVTTSGMPTIDNGSVFAYQQNIITQNALVACHSAAGGDADCYTPEGWKITNS